MSTSNGTAARQTLTTFLARAVVAIAASAAVAVFVWLIRSPEYRDAQRAIQLTTRLPAPPDQIRNAVIAAEEPSFWREGLRPALRDILSKRTIWPSKGECLKICQLRRIGAMWLVSTTHDKDTILKAYVWSVPMGSVDGREVVGLPSAATAYFGTDLWSLRLDQAATLAGMIPSPDLYSPIRSPELARKRRDFVLNLMRKQHLITQAEYHEASQTRDAVGGMTTTA